MATQFNTETVEAYLKRHKPPRDHVTVWITYMDDDTSEDITTIPCEKLLTFVIKRLIAYKIDSRWGEISIGEENLLAVGPGNVMLEIQWWYNNAPASMSRMTADLQAEIDKINLSKH